MQQQEPSVQPQTAPSHDHTSPASSRQLAEAHIFIRKLQRDIDTLQGELADANNRLAQWEDMISSTQVDVILTGNREQDEVIRNTQKRSEQISRNYRTTKAQLEELKTRQAVRVLIKNIRVLLGCMYTWVQADLPADGGKLVCMHSALAIVTQL